MTNAAAMTYTSLVDDIIGYAERSGDATFIAQVPRIIMLAENRIAAEAKGLGTQVTVVNNLRLGYADFEKPARWRETVSFNIGIGASNTTRQFLKLRSYEYCRTYWPDPSTTDVPKYYADWDREHWLIVPTPAVAYPFELVYHERPEPLSSDASTNWTTEQAPQLLLAACMLEAMPFLKNDQRIAVFQAMYDRGLQQVASENKDRMTDRTQAVK